jgi:hypothetical protein
VLVKLADDHVRYGLADLVLVAIGPLDNVMAGVEDEPGREASRDSLAAREVQQVEEAAQQAALLGRRMEPTGATTSGATARTKPRKRSTASPAFSPMSFSSMSSLTRTRLMLVTSSSATLHLRVH